MAVKYKRKGTQLAHSDWSPWTAPHGGPNGTALGDGEVAEQPTLRMIAR